MEYNFFNSVFEFLIFQSTIGINIFWFGKILSYLWFNSSLWSLLWFDSKSDISSIFIILVIKGRFSLITNVRDNFSCILFDKSIFSSIDFLYQIFELIEIKFVIMIDINVFNHLVGLLNSNFCTNFIKYIHDFISRYSTTIILIKGIKNFS